MVGAAGRRGNVDIEDVEGGAANGHSDALDLEVLVARTGGKVNEWDGVM